MRKVLLSLAAAASVVAVATPAAAQWAPRPVYGNAYGYGAGNFQAQIQQIRNQSMNLMRQGRLTRAESRDLNQDIRQTERAIYRSERNGLSPYEARAIQTRIMRLRNEVRRYSDYDRRPYRRY